MVAAEVQQCSEQRALFSELAAAANQHTIRRHRRLEGTLPSKKALLPLPACLPASLSLGFPSQQQQQQFAARLTE